MKLQLRQKSKREQSLDAFASVAKTWSEWHLGKKVSTTAAKGAKQAAKVKGTSRATGLKIAGAVALVGAAGAAVAKKLKGGQAEPLYTPPGPAPDMAPPPPSPVVVEDITGDAPATPPAETGTGTPPEPPPAPEYVPDTPVVVEDLAGEAPAAEEPTVDPPVLPADAASEPALDDEPAAPAAEEDETPSAASDDDADKL